MKEPDMFTEEYLQLVRQYWEYYVAGDRPLPEQLPGIRPVILESWRRSQGYFVDQSSNKFSQIPAWELDAILEANRELIQVAHSYIANLAAFIRDTNFMIALTDRDGCVIDTVAEDGGIMGLMRQSGLQVGVVRNERLTGTSGIAACLATGDPIQILGEEHYLQEHHNYFCSAVPIHDPDGALAGCLAMMSPREMVHTHTFGMVYIAVDGIQKELRMRKSNRQLQFVNTQIKNMIHSLSSGVLLLDQDRRVIQHNALVRSILRLPRELPLNGVFFQDIVTPGSIPEEIWNTSCSNRELSLATCKRQTIDVVLTSVITSGEAGLGRNTILIFEEQKQVRQLVQKMGGFTAQYTFDSIIGRSPQIERVKEMGRRVAKSASNVLILGESGTGKELLAQSIHNASGRAAGPFIAVNCGSIPKNLIESELFGYESGSFTGAKREGNPGKFELADGGTLFLDEIGDMPLDLQASLLRVLQNREVTRLGGKHAKYINVKVIAATNANLRESIQKGQFRQDLYYRLNVLTIHVPPLRERAGDIPLLAAHFIQSYSRSLHRAPPELDAGAYEALLQYPWPGNIRELENVIDRAVNLSQGAALTLADLPPELCAAAGQKAAPPPARPRPAAPVEQPAPRSPEILERGLILEAIAREKGHVKTVADSLGMPVRTLYRKLKKYQIDPEQYRRWDL